MRCGAQAGAAMLSAPRSARILIGSSYSPPPPPPAACAACPSPLQAEGGTPLLRASAPSREPGLFLRAFASLCEPTLPAPSPPCLPRPSPVRGARPAGGNGSRSGARRSFPVAPSCIDHGINAAPPIPFSVRADALSGMGPAGRIGLAPSRLSLSGTRAGVDRRRQPAGQQRQFEEDQFLWPVRLFPRATISPRC